MYTLCRTRVDAPPDKPYEYKRLFDPPWLQRLHTEPSYDDYSGGYHDSGYASTRTTMSVPEKTTLPRTCTKCGNSYDDIQAARYGLHPGYCSVSIRTKLLDLKCRTDVISRPWALTQALSATAILGIAERRLMAEELEKRRNELSVQSRITDTGEARAAIISAFNKDAQEKGPDAVSPVTDIQEEQDVCDDTCSISTSCDSDIDPGSASTESTGLVTCRRFPSAPPSHDGSVSISMSDLQAQKQIVELLIAEVRILLSRHLAAKTRAADASERGSGSATASGDASTSPRLPKRLEHSRKDTEGESENDENKDGTIKELQSGLNSKRTTALVS